MWFDRVEGILAVRRLAACRVVVVGSGRMGSRCAFHLARSGVGRFRFVDPDVFDDTNVPGHVLDARYIGWSKATALARDFMAGMPWVEAEGILHRVSSRSPNAYLISLMGDADLVVVTTDDMAAQFRAGRVAAALDIPAVFPGLYREHGGEVFVSLGQGLPCFECFSGFRPVNTPLRAVPATSHASLMVEQAAVHVALGVLDPASQFADILTGSAPTMPMQLLTVASFAAPHGAVFEDNRSWSRAAVQRRPQCPGCRASRRLAESLASARRPRRAAANERPPIQPTQSHSPSPRTSGRRRRFGVVAALATIGLVVAVGIGLIRLHEADEAPRVAPTLVEVHISRASYWSTPPAAIDINQPGAVYAYAKGATSVTMTASSGSVSRVYRYEPDVWSWVFYAPSRSGRVTLHLRVDYPGPQHPTETMPLPVTVKVTG